MSETDLSVDYKTINKEFLELIGWDSHTAVPTESTLSDLGMDFLIGDMPSAEIRVV
jgi:hypothetical protein